MQYKNLKVKSKNIFNEIRKKNQPEILFTEWIKGEDFILRRFLELIEIDEILNESDLKGANKDFERMQLDAQSKF